MPDRGPLLVASLLDRLTDPEPGGAGSTELQVRAAVRRDLSDLLNSRLTDVLLARDCPEKPRPGEPKRQGVCYGTGWRAGPVCGTCCPELKRSMAAYGLPDLTGYDVHEKGPCEEIGRVIERVIAAHEPRLAGVRVVVPRQPFNAVTRELTFSVEAVLAVDAATRVEFGTVIELISGQAKVTAAGRA